jgi:hypothetical protein
MEYARAQRGVTDMARYKMTVVFDVHEEVQMKYVSRETASEDGFAMAPLQYDVLGVTESDKKQDPHINKLYEDVLERIETSPKHPITYDIVSFEKLKEKLKDHAELF